MCDRPRSGGPTFSKGNVMEVHHDSGFRAHINCKKFSYCIVYAENISPKDIALCKPYVSIFSRVYQHVQMLDFIKTEFACKEW